MIGSLLRGSGSRSTWPGMLGVSAALAWQIAAGASIVAAAEPEPRRPEPAADVTRIERDLRDLRSAVRDLQRSDQEHFDALRRLIDRSPGRPSTEIGATTATGPTPAGAPGAGGAELAPAVAAAPAAPPVFATVTGSVNAKVPVHDVYVYLEGFHSSSGRKSALEITQNNKTFDPAVSVALVGTRATFPNRDTFFHNVFSRSPTPFDLGTYRADETAPGVTLDTPGIVDVFCNIHSQMHAQILVVPNRVFVRVGGDGTFRLNHVPVGRRKLVAWAPGMDPVRRTIDVSAEGARVAFDLEPAPVSRHTNKFGQPYGAYKE